MTKNFKAIISLPYSLFSSILFLKLYFFTFKELIEFYPQNSIFFFLKYILVSLIVGFNFSFTFLYLSDYKTTFLKSFSKKFIIKKIFNYFYMYLAIFIFFSIFFYSYSEYNTTKYNENYFLYIFIGIVIGIIGFLRNWKLFYFQNRSSNIIVNKREINNFLKDYRNEQYKRLNKIY